MDSARDKDLIQKYYLNGKRLVFDSSVWIELIERSGRGNFLPRLFESGYKIIFVAPAILEVAFGVQAKRTPGVNKLLNELHYGNILDSHEIIVLTRKDEGQNFPSLCSVAPGSMEWVQARNLLLAIMESDESDTKMVKRCCKLRMDALIFACARNFLSSIVTLDRNDFELLSEHSRLTGGSIMPPPPILSLDDLVTLTDKLDT